MICDPLHGAERDGVQGDLEGSALSYCIVKHWAPLFKAGLSKMIHGVGAFQQQLLRKVFLVEFLFMKDQWILVQRITVEMQLITRSVDTILHKHLHLFKLVCLMDLQNPELLAGDQGKFFSSMQILRTFS